MGAHVFHLAVVTRVEPALQVLFMLGQVQAADADLLKAQFAAPVFDRLGEGGQIGGDGRHETRETAG